MFNSWQLDKDDHKFLGSNARNEYRTKESSSLKKIWNAMPVITLTSLYLKKTMYIRR